MALFEVETNAHILITWAEDENEAKGHVYDQFPGDDIVRICRRPRNAWVISKSALGLTDTPMDPCLVARTCLTKAEGDKIHAIRLYMHETGNDLQKSRKVIESNMVMGW